MNRLAWRSSLVLYFFSISIGTGGRPAYADPPPPAAPPQREPSDDPRYRAAKARFEAAQALFDQGRFEEAYGLFRSAYEATSSPNAHLMMARCLSAQGKAPEAYEAMARTLKEATALAEVEPRYTATRDAAAAELALLDRRVGKLVIALMDPPAPDAVVLLNGRTLDRSALGLPLAVPPGVNVVELRSGGAEVIRRSIEVGAGETRTIALARAIAANEGAPRSPIALTPLGGGLPPLESSGPAGARMAGFALGGLGVAGMVVFGAAGAAANSKFAAVEKECGGARCSDPIYGPVVDTGKALDAAANAGLVVGLVGLLSGGALIALGGPKAPSRTAVSVSISREGAKLAVKGAF